MGKGKTVLLMGGGKYSTGTGVPAPEPAVYILLKLSLKFPNIMPDLTKQQ